MQTLGSVTGILPLACAADVAAFLDDGGNRRDDLVAAWAFDQVCGGVVHVGDGSFAPWTWNRYERLIVRYDCVTGFAATALTTAAALTQNDMATRA